MQIIYFTLLIGLASVVCGCGTLYSCRVEKQYPARGSFAPVENFSLHYVRAGEGSPAVLIHGNHGSLADWLYSPFYAQLVKRFDTLAYDRLGHGHSHRHHSLAMTAKDHARQLSVLLDELRINKPILIAHSAGAAVGLAFALAHPNKVKALVLLSGTSHPWPGRRVNFSERIAALPVVGELFLQTAFVPVGLAIRRTAFQSSFGEAQIPPHYFAEASALALRPGQFAATARDTHTLWDTLQDLSAHYDELKPPLLLISGDADTTVPVQNHSTKLKQQVADSTLVLLPGTAHQPQHTDGERVFEELMKFLHEHELK